MTPGRVDVAVVRQQHRDPDLGVQPVLAAADAPVRGDGVGEALPRLGNPGEVVVRCVSSRIAAREPLELLRRFVEPVRLQKQQPEGVAGVVVLGLLRHQVLELRTSLLVASGVHEHARIGHADRSRLWGALEKFLQHAERAFDVVRTLAQPCPQDCGSCIAGVDLVRAIGCRRRLFDVPRPDEKPGECKLRLRIVLMPEDELPHRGEGSLWVFLCAQELGGAMKSRTWRIGQRVHDFVEVFDRRIDVAGAYEQGRQHLPGLHARRIDLAPQARRLEREFFGMRENRELRRSRRHAGVPGLLGDVEVVSERKLKIAAMAGKLSYQQSVEYVSVQGVSGGRAFGRLIRSDRAHLVRCGTESAASREGAHHDCGRKHQTAEPLSGGHAQPLDGAVPLQQRGYGHRTLSKQLVRTINHRRYNAFVTILHAEIQAIGATRIGPLRDRRSG